MVYWAATGGSYTSRSVAGRRGGVFLLPKLLEMEEKLEVLQHISRLREEGDGVREEEEKEQKKWARREASGYCGGHAVVVVAAGQTCGCSYCGASTVERERNGQREDRTCSRRRRLLRACARMLWKP